MTSPSGRAGEAGKAYTLLTDKDKEFAPHLVRNLEGANQYVSEPLMELAGQCSWFKKTRFTAGKGESRYTTLTKLTWHRFQFDSIRCIISVVLDNFHELSLMLQVYFNTAKQP